VEHYLADPRRNKSAAYLKQHPDIKPESAWSCAARMFGGDRVSAYLDARRRQIAERLEVTPERVLGELAKLAFANAKDYFKWGPGGVRLRDHDELDAELAAAVAEVSETTTQHGGSVRLKLHDKKGALELLGRNLELFTDRTKHDAGDNWADILNYVQDFNERARSRNTG
jgi:phage terminase small subunit